MLILAGGGESCADIERLRAQERLFGAVPSDSTVYRTFRQIGPGEVAWRDQQIEIARLLAERYTAPAEGLPRVSSLDQVVAGWLDDDSSRADINTVVNSVVIALGQHVANGTGLTWVITAPGGRGWLGQSAPLGVQAHQGVGYGGPPRHMRARGASRPVFTPAFSPPFLSLSPNRIMAATPSPGRSPRRPPPAATRRGAGPI
jgi:hypothetical protein